MSKPHVLVVPYPEQGHVIPLMNLSLCLVKEGIKVTFVNTEHNHERIISAFPSDENNELLSQINLVWIADGLERKKPGKSSEAVLKVMPKKIEELIEGINNNGSEKVTCVVADQSIGWALDIAEKKGISRAAFCPASAAQLVIGFSIPKLIDSGIIDKHGNPQKKQVIQLSPKMPSVSTENLVWVSIGNSAAQNHIFQLMLNNINSMQLTQWVLCNSSHELEPQAFSLAPQITPIGPLLSTSNNDLGSGNFWPQDLTCLNWLDQQPPNSIIYVAFGSITTFTATQFNELCLGLEICNRPFLWVVRPEIAEGTKIEYPDGFVERVGDRSRIIGWAPQQMILSHSAVACFVSHCGWNSTLESVGNGIPILCWPQFADQFLNRSYVCDVWKVGIGLERDGSGVIMREEIRGKIEKLLNDEDLKARAESLKEKVQGGLSKKNLEKFIKWIKT